MIFAALDVVDAGHQVGDRLDHAVCVAELRDLRAIATAFDVAQEAI
jgi:hypothetical protein